MANMMRQWASKWNSFNPMKALVHAGYWSSIVSGTQEVLPPLAVSIDPCSACNLKCPHCNANDILDKIHASMDRPFIELLLRQLSDWKTKSVCIGGGGEAMVNPETIYLISRLSELGVQAAMITNGTRLRHAPITDILKLAYLGVSVDAATDAVWRKVKGVDALSITDVHKGMSYVAGQGLELTYKYLLLPDNLSEVYEACRIAKDIGCNQFHLRPGAAPWFEATKSYAFSKDDRENVANQVDRARVDFEDDSFKIYGVVAKVSDTWTVTPNFKKCWAVFTTCFISSNGDVGLCCDRRGDDAIVLGKLWEMGKLWGSKKHRDIHRSIFVKDCPRCTYGHVNEIFEHVLLEDKMFFNFF